MSIHIGLARTAVELDAVFKLRHRVFVEDEIYEPRLSGRVVDRFDAFPEVACVAARVDKEIVGTLRVMEYSPAGASADDYFDFTPYLPAEGRPGSASQLAVHPDYRTVPGLIFSMVAMGYSWAMQRGLTHLTAAARPEVRATLVQAGWKVLGETFFHEGHGLPVQPMLLDLCDLNPRFEDFIGRQRVEHVFSDFERVLYRAGEVICQSGDPADDVFVVVDGEIRVTNDSGRELARLGAGELVGEIALLTDQHRSANVEAVSDTWLMTLSRTNFSRQLEERPEAARAVLELLARRLVRAGDGIGSS